MSQSVERRRASSLIVQLTATQEIMGLPGRAGDYQRRSRGLSLDSKLEHVSQQNLLSSVDNKLLIQEVKFRLISFEVEDRKKRRGSVRDLVKVFDNEQLEEGPLNKDECGSLRVLLRQFTFEDLCEELRKRLEPDDISRQTESYDSQDRRYSQSLRRILFQKGSRSLSKGSFGKENSLLDIPEIELPLDQGDSSVIAHKCKPEMPQDNHSLQLPSAESKISFEPKLQKGAPVFKSKEEVEEEMFMDVLDDIFALKQTMWNAAKDIEALSAKITKVRGELAILRQTRTAYTRPDKFFSNRETTSLLL